MTMSSIGPGQWSCDSRGQRLSFRAYRPDDATRGEAVFDASPTIADTDVERRLRVLRGGYPFAVTYVPPAGWTEDFRGDTWGRIRASFHRRRDCVRIRDAADLREVDKPYDATRCSHCARD